MCCCCCPPAINALLYLWIRSGFSKGSVAGALTFFPPDPPLYKFQRVDKNGEVLEDEEDEEDAKRDAEADAHAVVAGRDGDDSDLETFEIDAAASSRRAARGDDDDPARRRRRDADVDEARRRRREEQERQAAAAQDPVAAMTERAARLRRRAKRRARIDKADARNGVTYRFAPDAAALGALPPPFGGTVRAVKIGPQKKTGSYVAALLYRLPEGECGPTTKTIVYSHGNATDVGAMAGLQCLIAKVRCAVRRRSNPGPVLRAAGSWVGMLPRASTVL